MTKETTYYTIYSPSRKGYWVGGFGNSAEFDGSIEAAQIVRGAEGKITELLDQIDPAEDSSIYWEQRQTPNGAGTAAMLAHFV